MTDSLIQRIQNQQETATIDIVDDDGQAIGRLVPVTKADLSDADLIQKLVDWRNQYRGRFLTQFTATFERTRAWLSDCVLTDPTRLLFMMESGGKRMGHIGFFNLDWQRHTAELDNIMRGELGGHRRLAYYAEMTMARWMFEALGLDSIYVRPLADNSLVIKIHLALGFEEAAKIPLTRTERDGEIKMEMGEPGMPSPSGLYCRRFDLTAERFRTFRSQAAGEYKR